MKKLLLIASLALCVSVNAAPKVHYISFEGKMNEALPVKEFNQKGVSSKAKINPIKVHPELEYQTLQGIGGSFNEIGGVALMSLPQAEREKVMSNLFGQSGASLSLCRTAVGSSDFGVDAYSYSEKEGDYNMDHFSIEREKTSVIPYIQMALKYNPEMKLFGSPWSPPAWMKYSKTIDKGSSMQDKNFLIDDPKIYAAYAKYFRKYVESYAEQGIRVDRIVVQNETDIHTKYPSCVMNPDQMHLFISKYLRKEFNKSKIKTGIWAGTFRTAHRELHGQEYVSDPERLAAVDGIGIQYTKANYISDIHYFLKGQKPLMHTESNCHGGQNSVTQAKNRFAEVISYINHGTENFTYWNMILNQTKKSGWDWAQNSLININTDTKEVTYNPDYAVMSLLSKFIRPGAQRIGVFFSKNVLAVKYKDKKYVFVQNDTNEVQPYVIFEGKYVSKDAARVFIPANSLSVIEY